MLEIDIDSCSKEIELACSTIVDSICSQLDEYVKSCQEIIEDKSQDISNSEMDSIILTIPTLLYWVKHQKEILGIKMDLAEKIKEDKWNESFLAASGNTTNQKVQANQATTQEAFDCIVYERAYKMIDNREGMAFELMQSVKKIMTRKMGGFQ